VLPAADAANFMNEYANYTGYNNETSVIKAAHVLLSNTHVQAFLALPDSFGAGGLDADLVLCAVLVEATPAGLANYSATGKAQEATVDALLSDTVLMRDMLVAGGATSGGLSGAAPGVARAYGQAAALFAQITKASAVLSPVAAAATASRASTPWDDRTQTKEAVLRRAALATAVEHAVPVNLRFAQTVTPPWGPQSDPNVTHVDPVARYMHYENAYLAGDLDPAFEVTTAFEMRHTLNADADDGDLGWMRETMANYDPDYIAMNYSVGRDWRYAESVHHDVAYVHTHCPQPNYTLVCSGHYSMIPAKGGICGFRAFWSRITRKAFGIPTWGATHSGHAAMTSWNPQGWVVMLAGPLWEQGRWGAQGGDDFHLDVQARELRTTYQQFLRGSWAGAARGDAPAGIGWDCNFGGKNKCSGFGVGGLWPALMLYQKKAAVAAHTLANGSSAIPVRPIGPSAVPTKVDAYIAKTKTAAPLPKVTTDAAGTITLPAAAFAPAPLTTADVNVTRSYLTDGTQLMHNGGNVYKPDSAALVYQLDVETAGTYYLTANHSTWHTDQDLMLAVNGKKMPNVPVYFTMGYWNQTQPVEIALTKGKNTLTFTRLSTTQTAFKEFFLYTAKPAIAPPPGGGFTPQPITPPLPASAFILEQPATSCTLQGIKNVPEELCEQACLLVANRTFTGGKQFTNVKGCFAIMSGPYKGNCNYNLNTSAVCIPPCGADQNLGEICLTASELGSTA
jgi:hypothetical protein